jgi:hypothetical protein
MVTMKLKQNQYSVADLTKAIDHKVLPVLRMQEGFKNAVFCANPNGTEAIGFTMWDRSASAESYGEKAYPEVLTSLTPLLDGGPHVKSFEVISSTLNDKVVSNVK